MKSAMKVTVSFLVFGEQVWVDRSILTFLNGTESRSRLKSLKSPSPIVTAAELMKVKDR